MDAAQWQQHHQQIGDYSRPMEEMIQIQNNNNHNPNNNNPTNMSNNNSRGATPIVGDQRRARPQKDQNLNCPRCNSTNTKFCYYNNYSLTQPRYFCKTCRRYWTQGGSLRNVPVGGGSRKNKISSSSSSLSSSITSSSSSIITSSIITTTSTPLQNLIPTNNNKLIPDLNPPNSLSHLINPPQNPKLFLEGHDLNLAFPIQGMFHPPSNNGNNNNHNSNNNNNENSTCSTTTTTNNNNNSCSSSHQVSALELLRTGMASRGPTLNPYVPMPMPDSNTLYPSGLPNLQEFKTNHNNMNNMVGSGDGNNNVASGGGARLLFPFADMNKLANSTPTTTPHHHHHQHHHHMDDQSKAGNDHHHHHHQNPTTGYWSGMLGGGTW